MGRLRAAVSQGAYFQHNGIWRMKGVLKAILLAALLSAASMLSGCTLLYGDSLLALPSLPAEYVELQKEINKVLSTGAVSAAPVLFIRITAREWGRYGRREMTF